MADERTLQEHLLYLAEHDCAGHAYHLERAADRLAKLEAFRAEVEALADGFTQRGDNAAGAAAFVLRKVSEQLRSALARLSNKTRSEDG